jgi:lysophospholipase L1-like esterase
MGDSIVAGWYWVPVFSDDHRDQCNFWLVGSAEGDNIYVPSREGHGSATTGDFLAEQWHTTATENYDPDVVLLMLGTNDYSDPDATAAGTAAQLKQIVDEIHAVNADVEIFVAIIPRTNKEMADYDAALQTMPDVTYVDQFSGFDPETMTDDGVHPNDIGSQLIADVYYAALQSAGYCP